MTPPRAVILDLGNVLAFHDNALLFRRLGERAGLRAPEAERRLSGAGWTAANRGELDGEGIRRDVCGALGVDIPAGEFFALWSCHFTVHDAVLPRVEALVEPGEAAPAVQHQRAAHGVAAAAAARCSSASTTSCSAARRAG